MGKICKWLVPVALAGALATTPGFSAEPSEEFVGERVERRCEIYSNKDIRGTIEADLVGTPLSAGSTGEALFRFKNGVIVVTLKTRRLPKPNQIGREYLTYVAWSVDAESVFQPLGELQSKDKAGTLKATLASESLGLVVTAEPHFAVTRPSDTVVLRAVPAGKGASKLRSGETSCSFLPRGHYTLGRTAEELGVLLAGDVRTPEALLQARNAVAIAKLTGSGEFASERYQESAAVLLRAQELLGRGRRGEATEAARRAVEIAASAERIASLRRQEATRTKRELDETQGRLAAVERELESARRTAVEEAARRQAAEARSRVADERPRTDEASLERIERAIGRLNQQPAAVAPSVTPVPGSSAAPDRERALEEQLLKTRLEVDKLRMEMEVAQQRAVVERDRERLETERSLFVAEQARLTAEQGKLVEERARVESDRLRLEAQRTEPTTTTTPTSAEREALVAPTVEEVSGPARRPERTVDPLPSAPTLTEARTAPANSSEPARLDRGIDASQQQREREIDTREAALAAREAELEHARIELLERDAALESIAPARIPLTENTDVEPAVEPPVKQKRSLWPFGRKKRRAEDAAETASLTGDTKIARSSANPALTSERGELDRSWQELQYAREALALDRQNVDLERRRVAATPGAPAPVQVVPPVAAPSNQPPVTLLYTPPTAGLQVPTAAPTPDRLEIEAQQRRLVEQQDQLIALTQKIAEASDEADRVALQQQLDEQNRALELQRAELEQERVRLDGLGERIEIERRMQERATRRSELIGRLARAGEVLDQDGSAIVRLPRAFVTGGATLRPEAQDGLAKLAVAVSGLSGLSVTVEGHTDDTGSDEANLELSRRRAEAVRDRLVELGVPSSSIRASGIGEARPLASNATSEGRARNRRVEVIIASDEIRDTVPTQDRPKAANLAGEDDRFLPVGSSVDGQPQRGKQ